jgi:hypothetical protein
MDIIIIIGWLVMISFLSEIHKELKIANVLRQSGRNNETF